MNFTRLPLEDGAAWMMHRAGSLAMSAARDTRRVCVLDLTYEHPCGFHGERLVELSADTVWRSASMWWVAARGLLRL
jgi:hypothetical protein